MGEIRNGPRARRFLESSGGILSCCEERYAQLATASNVEFLDVDDSWDQRKFPYLMANFGKEARE
jgi:hypothetical protein